VHLVDFTISIYHDAPSPERQMYTQQYIQICSVYSEKLLTMHRGTVRNMQSFIPKINLSN